MNKIRLFMVAGTLLLVAAGVFATKTAKTLGTTPSELYYSSTGFSTDMHPALSLSGADVLFGDTQAGSSWQWSNISKAGITYGLYYYTGIANNYYPVYPNF